MFQVGVPYLWGAAWRTPPIIQPGSVDVIAVPILAAEPGQATLVSLDGCLTWRPAPMIDEKTLGVKVAGQDPAVDEWQWRLPAGQARWLWLRHGEHVAKCVQPIVCTGPRSDQPVIAPDVIDTDLHAGFGAPSDELRLPAGTTGYLDVLTGDVYEWTDNDSEVM